MPKPVDHVRAIIQAHRDGAHPPAEALAWAAEGFAMHLHQGIDLPHAMGLVRYGGGGSNATRERRQQRDDMLREIHRRFYESTALTAAADEILEALARQRRARGRVTDDLSRMLELLLNFDPAVPTTSRQLRRILDINSLFKCPTDIA